MFGMHKHSKNEQNFENKLQRASPFLPSYCFPKEDNQRTIKQEKFSMKQNKDYSHDSGGEIHWQKQQVM